MSVQRLCLWQVVRGFERGSYIEGDVFINELGQEISFDGQRIIGIDKVDVNTSWRYVKRLYRY